MLKHFLLLFLLLSIQPIHLGWRDWKGHHFQNKRVRVNALTLVQNIGRGFVMVSHAMNGNNNKGPFYQKYVFDQMEFNMHIHDRNRVYVIEASCFLGNPWKDWVGQQTWNCRIKKVKK